jgi:hypothetical protein
MGIHTTIATYVLILVRTMETDAIAVIVGLEISVDHPILRVFLVHQID